MALESRTKILGQDVKLLIVLPETREESKLIDEMLGDCGAGDVPVVGEVCLSGDLDTHYIRLRAAETETGSELPNSENSTIVFGGEVEKKPDGERTVHFEILGHNVRLTDADAQERNINERDLYDCLEIPKTEWMQIIAEWQASGDPFLRAKLGNGELTFHNHEYLSEWVRGCEENKVTQALIFVEPVAAMLSALKNTPQAENHHAESDYWVEFSNDAARLLSELGYAVGLDAEYFDGDEGQEHLICEGLKTLTKMLEPLKIKIDSDEQKLLPAQPQGDADLSARAADLEQRISETPLDQLPRLMHSDWVTVVQALKSVPFPTTPPENTSPQSSNAELDESDLDDLQRYMPVEEDGTVSIKAGSLSALINMARNSLSVEKPNKVGISVEAAKTAVEYLEDEAESLFDDVGCAGQEGADVANTRATHEKAQKVQSFAQEIAQAISDFGEDKTNE